MNATELQKTVFVCGACKREHNQSTTAEACCMCADCCKRPATVREYSSPTWCAQCAAARARKRARDAVDHARRQVVAREGDLKRARSELEKAETAYAALGGKRRGETVQP